MGVLSVAEMFVVDVLVKHSKSWAHRSPGGLTVSEIVKLVNLEYGKGQISLNAIARVLHKLLQRGVIFGLPEAELGLVEGFAFIPLEADTYCWVGRIPERNEFRLKRFYVVRSSGSSQQGDVTWNG